MAEDKPSNHELRFTAPIDVTQWIISMANARGISMHEMAKRLLATAYENYLDRVGT